MSFTVKTLNLEDFRSYRQEQFEFDSALTILCGVNAAGKTNIIEALQLLTEGTSFRRPQSADLISWDKTQARATLTASDKQRRREVTLTVRDNKRTFTVNNKRLKSAQEMAGILPCVIFTPNDLRIVKENSERRRDALDALGTQLSVTYARLLSEYKKIVIQRNRLLKEEQNTTDVFEAWTQRLVSVGVALYEKRRALFEKLKIPLQEFYHHIDPCCELTLTYLSSFNAPEIPSDTATLEAAFIRALALATPEEQSRRSSVIGPHRDDVRFTLDSRDVRTFGSQGQQRSIALAWKLAEISTIKDIGGVRPLLLLDDVMSELDEGRRAELARLVGTVAQTVITTANIDYFQPELLARASLITIPSEET